MEVKHLNTAMVEAYLERDRRCVLPIGSTEQHGPLSLAVDAILAEKVAIDAAEPLGVPVFPPMNYGLCPYFSAYPGTVTLKVETLLAVVRDILESLAETGFRQILIVNGHGGNTPAAATALDVMRDNPNLAIKFHNWWMAPKTRAKVDEIDPLASHASWMENFPWTRLPNLGFDARHKAMVDVERMRLMGPAAVRQMLGDGVFGGDYQKPDDVMVSLWQVAVAETRECLEGPWA